MKRKYMIIIIVILVVIICTFIITSCFTYGRPDSIFVNIVGRNLENFIELEKTETVSLENRDLTIVYLRKTYDQYNEYPKLGGANNPGDNSYLIVKKTNENTEQVIFQGNLGHEIRNVIIDKNNKLLFYTLRDIRNEFRNCNLIIFDLETMQTINRILLSDQEGMMSRIAFDEINQMIYFRLALTTVAPLSYDINNGNLKEITDTQFNELYEIFNLNPSFFISNNIIIRLFSIVPFSDYLPANFKHKYNGIYINNGSNNIRISRRTEYLNRNTFWLENGSYVVNGSYIFDTSGRLNEHKLVDGEILAIF